MESVPSMVLIRPIQPGPRSHQQDGGLRTSCPCGPTKQHLAKPCSLPSASILLAYIRCGAPDILKALANITPQAGPKGLRNPMALRQASERTGGSLFEEVSGTKWQTTQTLFRSRA